MFAPRQLYILFMVCCLFPLQAFTYPVDSLMAAIGQVPVEDQHKKVMNELTRLRDSKPVDGVELGNYWINILNEKQLRPEAAATILLTATCYYRIGNYAQCLQYTQTARNLFKLNGNPDGEAQSLRDLGFCYAHMDAYEDAYESYQKSIAIFDRLGNNNELAGCYNHLGNLIEEWKKDYTTAQKLYETSMAYAVKANNQESISYSLEFIGIIKSELGDNDSAIVYFDRSLTIRKELNLPVPLAISYTNIAEVMHKKGDLNGAEHYFREALTISRNLQYNDLTTFLYENLSKVHKKKGNLDSAITYMELQQAMKDSLFNLQKTQEFAEIKEKYESELKEEKIRNLNKQIEIKNQKYRNRIYFFTVVVVSMGALVLLALLILVYFYYKEQRKVALEKIEEEKLRNKMIIEAEEKERTRIAKDLHDSLGQMLAALKMNLHSIQPAGNGQLDKTARILDDTIAEMRSISHAMMPESLMKNGLAKALIDIGDHVDSTGTTIHVQVENWKGWDRTGEYVIYRVVQELINNSLKHAQATKINIELNQFEDEINLMYDDNGKGFDIQDATKKGGIGLNNMRTRIASLNGYIEIDSQPGKGTTAVISIPLNTHKT